MDLGEIHLSKSFFWCAKHFENKNGCFKHLLNPIGSMYDIFTYIWLIFMVNVGIYTTHGSYGNYCVRL